MIQDAAQLRVRVDRCVSGGKTMPRKITGELCQNRLVGPVQRSGVSDKHRTMVLGAARYDRGRERNAKARSLVAKQIRQTGSLVVLLFWQE